MTKISDVENFTRFLIEMTGIYSVDEEGYVISVLDNAPITIKAGKSRKPLMVVQEVIQDNEAILINPVNENLREDQGSKFLYTALSGGLVRKCSRLVYFLEELRQEGDDCAISSDLAKFASRYLPKMDAKVLEEFKTICSPPLEFMNVWFRRNFKEARFRCNVFQPETFKSVRKKTLNVILPLFAEILGVKKTDDITEAYNFKSKSITSPKLDSILNIYLQLYNNLNQYLAFIPDSDYTIDITELGHHINNLEDYYGKVKFLTSTVDADTTVTNPAVPVKGGIPIGQHNNSSHPRMAATTSVTNSTHPGAGHINTTSNRGGLNVNTSHPGIISPMLHGQRQFSGSAMIPV